MRPHEPFWPKSLLVGPAHLGASDTYRARLRARAVARVLPDAYGLVASEYDEYALARGELVFPRILVVFPSGLEAWTSGADPLEADVQTRLYGLGTSIAAYLAVPRAVIDGPNVSPEGKGARSTRYLSDLDAEVPGIRPNLEIVFEDYPRNRYERSEVLSLGRVERAGETMRFDPTAWPTVLHARACPPMMGAIQNVIRALRKRRRELLDARKVQPFHLLSTNCPQTEVDLLVIVSRVLAALLALVRRRTTPPFEFYRHLRGLYLELVSFEEGLEQPPAYKHEDLGAIFPWLVTRICDLVERVVRHEITALPFERTDERGKFVLSFRREDLPKWKRPILVATCRENAQVLIRLPALLKMAAPTSIEMCMHSAVHGVRVRIEDEPPRPVPSGYGTMAYTILRKDDRHEDGGPRLSGAAYWDQIMELREIHVYLADAPPTLQLSLYCVDRES